jgi:hypothetical protein
MPRRRALRLAGAAVAAAVVPGLRPGTGRASSQFFNTTCAEVCSKGTTCGFETNNGGYVGCNKGCCIGAPNEKRTVCCNQNQETGSWCCGTGETCGSGANTLMDPNCRPACPPERKCEDNCCLPDEICRNPKRGVCCDPAWITCEAGSAGVVGCCPVGHTCAVDFHAKTAKCCGPDQNPVDGGCRCKDKTRKPCGSECCTKGKYCSKGKCCPTNRVNCGDDYCCGSKGTSCSNGKCCPKGMVNCGGAGKCCAKVDCCDKTCCKGDSVCVNGTCCPPGRGFGSGKNAGCCPPGTVPTHSKKLASITYCCPANDPGCCKDNSPLGQVTCTFGETCVAGACTEL